MRTLVYVPKFRRHELLRSWSTIVSERVRDIKVLPLHVWGHGSSRVRDYRLHQAVLELADSDE